MKRIQLQVVVIGLATADVSPGGDGEGDLGYV